MTDTKPTARQFARRHRDSRRPARPRLWPTAASRIISWFRAGRSMTDVKTSSLEQVLSALGTQHIGDRAAA